MLAAPIIRLFTLMSWVRREKEMVGTPKPRGVARMGIAELMLAEAKLERKA